MLGYLLLLIRIAVYIGQHIVFDKGKTPVCLRYTDERTNFVITENSAIIKRWLAHCLLKHDQRALF